MAQCSVLLLPGDHLGWHELRRALATIPDCAVVGEATDVIRAARLAREQRPTAIIASPMLANEPSAPLLAALHDELGPLTIILFATDCAPGHFAGQVERWLSGYLLWHQLSPDSLHRCLAALLDGDIVLGNRAAIVAFAAALRGDYLDPTIAAKINERERAVLRELAQGHTTAEIAKILSCSERTVRRCIEHAELVLDAPDRFVLAVKAMHAKLLT